VVPLAPPVLLVLLGTDPVPRVDPVPVPVVGFDEMPPVFSAAKAALLKIKQAMRVLIVVCIFFSLFFYLYSCHVYVLVWKKFKWGLFELLIFEPVRIAAHIEINEEKINGD
jgi:hypothetical protein